MGFVGVEVGVGGLEDVDYVGHFGILLYLGWVVGFGVFGLGM